MKRNMDLARQILLEIEKQPFTNAYIEFNNIGDYTTEEISYHVMILGEAELLVPVHTFGTYWETTRLTWEGHEFLAAARDDTRWKKACSMMLEKGGDIALGVLKQLLLHLMMGELGL